MLTWIGISTYDNLYLSWSFGLHVIVWYAWFVFFHYGQTLYRLARCKMQSHSARYNFLKISLPFLYFLTVQRLCKLARLCRWALVDHCVWESKYLSMYKKRNKRKNCMAKYNMYVYVHSVCIPCRLQEHEGYCKIENQTSNHLIFIHHLTVFILWRVLRL